MMALAPVFAACLAVAARAQDPNAPVAAPVDRVAGLFLQLGPDDYVVVGRSMGVYFESATDPTQSVGLATVEEGQYVNGRWVAGRRLNGDETPEMEGPLVPGRPLHDPED